MIRDNIDIKIGDTIYYEEPRTHFILKAKIIEIIKHKETKETDIKVKNLCYVNKNGEKTEMSYGSNYVLGKIFKNLNEAYAYAEKAKEIRIKMYCDLIENVNDLIKFPLQHTLVGELTDWDAIDAYKIRAHELLDIEL